jgi:hypothetical protein
LPVFYRSAGRHIKSGHYGQAESGDIAFLMAYFCLKQLIYKIVKIPMIVLGMLCRSTDPGVFFLIYHRIGTDAKSEIDMPLNLFSRQMAFLRKHKKIVTYEEAVRILESRQKLSNNIYTITFDDGDESLYTHAFPVCKRLQIPMIVFVPTGLIENTGACDKAGAACPDRRFLTWSMLREMLNSNLVTLGSHTFTHLNLTIISNIGKLEIMSRRLRSVPTLARVSIVNKTFSVLYHLYLAYFYAIGPRQIIS